MFRRVIRDYNWFLLGCTLVLTGFSIALVYSATLNAVTAYGTPLRPLFNRHLVNLATGGAAMLLFTVADYRALAALARPIYLAAVGVLALVLVIGRVSEGAQSWIAIGTRTIQPSEPAKLLVIVALAAYYQRFQESLDRPLVHLGALILTGIPMVLVLQQNDLGTAVVFAAIWLAMAWAAGIRVWLLGALFVLAIPVVYAGWQYVLDDEQKSRLLVFWWLNTDPARVDAQGDGYNTIQSLTAIGSGQLTGKGLTRGLLSQGNYLPVQYTDFIFAVAGEELGFAGGITLLIFLGLLMYLALRIAASARDTFGRLIAVGIMGMCLCHVVVNVGMNIALMPVTGLPLPFISYGGSFTITMLAAIGLLQSIALNRHKFSFE